MHNCDYCSKECKNKNSYTQHVIRCKNNPNRIEQPNRAGKNNPMYGKTGGNQFTTGRCTHHTAITKLKLGKISKGKLWTEDRKASHSDIMIEAVKNNPESYTKNNISGRVKQIEYNGVKLKGSWEVLTAKWLDSKNIEWLYEPHSFEYQWLGKTRLYFPDFYLPVLDLYIEVKGYKTERDIAKWEVLTNLVVLEKEHIYNLDNIEIF